MTEPTPAQKQRRSKLLRKLSTDKYRAFVDEQKGTANQGLVIGKTSRGARVLLHNNIELIIMKDALPGDFVHVTIKD